jgi:hypothetical protein
MDEDAAAPNGCAYDGIECQHHYTREGGLIMHSFHFTESGTGREVNIHYNGDYSGDAIIMTECDGVPVDFEIPCAALMRFAGEAVRNKIVGAIEEMNL